MFSSTLRRNAFAPRSFANKQLIPATARRHLQISTILQRDVESKDTINTESREYSRSGGDGAASGATDDAAFNPDKTRPEEERESARKESGGDKNSPLDVSPANPEVSKTNDPQKGGATGSKSETGEGSERVRSSGKGSPVKSGGGKSG